MVLMLPIVLANVETESTKAYIDNERVDGVDEDGGDIDVIRSDNLEMIVGVLNNYNETIKIKIRGVIEDINKGSDIEKIQDWFDVSADESRSKTLAFVIPSDAAKDNYDLVIRVYYKFSNNSEFYYDTDYTVNVVDESSQINLQTAMYNLTTSCNEVTKGLGTCFGYMGTAQNLTADLSTCKEDRGSYNTAWTNCNESLRLCNEEKIKLKMDGQQCQNEKALMISLTDCNKQVSDAKKEVGKKKDQIMFGIIAVGIIAFVWQRKKKQNISVDKAHEYYRK